MTQQSPWTQCCYNVVTAFAMLVQRYTNIGAMDRRLTFTENTLVTGSRPILLYLNKIDP